MNKTKYLLTTLSLFIMLPSITYAECASDEVKHFKEIEDKYHYSYKIDEQTKKYTITFYSEEADRYDYAFSDIYDSNCTIIDDKMIECSNVEPGSYDIAIVGTSDSCDAILKTEKIKLARYNEYSNDPLCEGIEEFVLCQKTYDKDIDYDTFASRVNTYKKTKNSQQETSNVEDKEKNEIIIFIEKNLLKIIIITSFGIAVIVSLILTIKSVKKSRRLE